MEVYEGKIPVVLEQKMVKIVRNEARGTYFIFTTFRLYQVSPNRN